MDRPVTTTIRVSAETWALLRRLAQRRAEVAGGRPSASAVITALVQREAKRREVRNV